MKCKTFQVVTAETAFLCLSMFNILRLSITLFFPLAISQLGEMATSINKIQVGKMCSDSDFILKRKSLKTWENLNMKYVYGQERIQGGE